jgi:CRP-like cAMP-binding protein
MAVLDNPFLRDLTPEQYDLLAALFEAIDVPAQKVIFQQGDVALYMYVLLEGVVRLQYKPYDGPTITLTQLHTGDVCGWSAVIGNEAYTSDAVAATPVRLLRARGDTLRRLCAEYPSAGRSILEKLAKAVSPRWVDAQRQIQSVLESEVFPKT